MTTAIRATPSTADYRATVADLVEQAGQHGQPEVVFKQSTTTPAARHVRRRYGRRVDRIEVNPQRINPPNAEDYSHVILARAVADRGHRDPVRTVLAVLVSAFIAASSVAMMAPLLLTGDRTAAFPGIGALCFSMALCVLAGIRADLNRDKNAAELVGRDALLRWLDQQPQTMDTRLRISRLGGRPRPRRATNPTPRPRKELSWRITLGVLAVVWIVLYATPTIGAIGDFATGTVKPDDTSTVWASLHAATRLVASAVLAVAIWVVVRKWRNLTWTQVGLPYQRTFTGKHGKTKLTKSRRNTTLLVFGSFFVAAAIASCVGGIVGGEPSSGIGIDNPLVAIVQCIRAGIFEELGLVAVPAALVLYRTQVDRPTGNPWMYILLIAGSGVARAIPHMYYGSWALLWAFTWGSLVMASYLRWRRILPLIAAHITLDLLVTLYYQLT
ncbi:hypothetical protein OPAG_08139 [Rhodococcus opacus PD630]|uniref:CPBP family intramembrane glutamic endopeptidase n=1 Tax=Rhodococcus opacus TaxID=37919 RepID=UPI00029CC1A7|nr:CPBP family intramembrane glutamic endopeptidase [Rhodococcus opacus]AHK35340.1 hypothetical protein Pd630_LPD09100 [Rhodococcus opacus PD630]EHI41321.1 hypothetical protein OPAG_08139 [Rhodococcus opacus PD630]